jgi:hypothetical protein
VQVNMTTSGEYDAYNFMDIAMKKVKSNRLTKIGCFYFFLRCEGHPAIDVHFDYQMEISLMGSTDTPLSKLSVVWTGSIVRKKAHMQKLCQRYPVLSV